jgi:hypothetical protein
VEKIAYDELHSLYSSPNIVRVIKSRRMRWAGHEACKGEGKISLGRPGRMYEDNIKMYLCATGID